MSTIIERFDKIKLNIASHNLTKSVNIIAVSKTFPLENVQPLIQYGHIHFGENKVQEAEKKWTAERKDEIYNSRTKTSYLLYKTLKEVPNEVKTFISASAIGYYGLDTGSINLKENAPVGHDFLARVVDAWETSTSKISELGIRLVQLRIGVVLSQKGGALVELLKPPVAAPLGKGNQYMSWIHIEDLCHMFRFMRVKQVRPACRHITKCAGARTNRSQNHHGGMFL